LRSASVSDWIDMEKTSFRECLIDELMLCVR